MAHPAQGKPKRRRKIPQDHYDTVSGMLMSVVPTPMIINQLSMRWSKPKKYVQDVIVRVHEDWALTAAATSDTRRHQIRHGMEMLLFKALKTDPNNPASKGDLHLAARLLSELGRLDGCYRPAETTVTVQGGMGIGVGITLGALGFRSQDEVRERIDELKARLAKGGPDALSIAPTADPAAAVAALAGKTAATAGFEDAEDDSTT